MIIARHLETLNLTPDGIPKDFADVMQYFNKGLKTELPQYKFIPRTEPITLEEIKTLWIPSLITNITLIAHDIEQNRAVGSATVFYDPAFTAYQPKLPRMPGEIGLSTNPDYPYKKVAEPLLRGLIRELRTMDKRTTLHTDSQFRAEIAVLSRLGYRGRFIQDYPRYKEAGLSGKVLGYQLP